MPPSEPATAYVLKMYPRFSETFIVSEILAREAAGDRIEIFSLRPPNDPRFHPELARVKAPVTYIARPKSASACGRPSGAAEAAGLAPAVSRVFAELAAADPERCPPGHQPGHRPAEPQHQPPARALRVNPHDRREARLGHHRDPVFLHGPRRGHLR